VSPGNLKVDPRNLIAAHYRTYIDVRTGRQRWQDYFVLMTIPVGCLVGGVRLVTGASVGLLTVSGLLSAFLFGVMLQISERAMDWTDSSPVPGPDTSSHACYLSELAANAGYASLLSVTAAAIFVVASVSSGWTLRFSSAIGLAVALHMALVLLMVMRRVFALTEERLNRARTGAERRASDHTRRKVS
jgi:hypothetical protein